jgi:predicted XRE-type DNA-binding protein
MSKDDFELVHGSGNVFRDMGYADAEVLQLKAVLGAKIIGVLDDRKISVRRAHELTGFAAADFSRVRQAKLQRFTIDRLMAMLGRLDQDIEVSVKVRPRPAARRKRMVSRVKRSVPQPLAVAKKSEGR